MQSAEIFMVRTRTHFAFLKRSAGNILLRLRISAEGPESDLGGRPRRMSTFLRPWVVGGYEGCYIYTHPLLLSQPYAFPPNLALSNALFHPW
jgi:hypothetical protein